MRVLSIAIGVAVVAITLIWQRHALLPVPSSGTQVARDGLAVAPPVDAATTLSVARLFLHDAPEALPPLGKPSITVLAFTNMSGDIDQEYFSDCIAENIITQLSHSSALNVIARNSTFTYKGQGREFGVRYVLEGSVRRDGERVRVSTQLVEANTGNHIWAERFDRAVTDIFAVQDEIADAAAQAIAPQITHAEQQRISRRPPESLAGVGGISTRPLAHGQSQCGRQRLGMRVLPASRRARRAVSNDANERRYLARLTRMRTVTPEEARVLNSITLCRSRTMAQCTAWTTCKSKRPWHISSLASDEPSRSGTGRLAVQCGGRSRDGQPTRTNVLSESDRENSYMLQGLSTT